MQARKNVRRNTVARKQRLAESAEGIKRVAFIMLPLLILGILGYFAIGKAKSAFIVNKVVFTGNVHLPDEDLKNLAELKGGENLLTLSGWTLFRRLSSSPWVSYVAVRKEFPDKLHILVRETEPFALLDMKGRLFIVDEKGKMLEELRESSMPFLPIINGNPYKEKEGFFEAINLVRAIKETGLPSRKNHIEIIAHKLHEIALNLDGVVVKIGAGDYADKLSRLMELEDEIKARRIPVDYIDLRFANRVIVKPVNEVIR